MEKDKLAFAIGSPGSTSDILSKLKEPFPGHVAISQVVQAGEVAGVCMYTLRSPCLPVSEHFLYREYVKGCSDPCFDWDTIHASGFYALQKRGPNI
jgi:hypothetical protein